MYKTKFLNKAFKALTIVSLCFFIASTSGCKKKKAFEEENAQEALDVGVFKTEGDAVIEEINSVTSDQFLIRGKGQQTDEALSTNSVSICGMSLDSLSVASGILRLVYNGSLCNGRKRTGIVNVTVMDYPIKKWKQRNCTLKVDFLAYKVVGVNDGRTMQIDGTFFIINESGSTWYDMRFLKNVPLTTNMVTGNDIKLTFDTKEVAIINVNRRFTYTVNGTVITAQAEGIGEHNGKSTLEFWGKSRDGKDFTSQVQSSHQWNTTCSALMPLSGESKVNVEGKYFELNVYYGQNASGNEFSGNDCATHWKVSWDYKKKTNKRILSYSR